MKTRIFNLIVLDESGSMESIKQATINGFNETVQSIKSAQQKFTDQEHFVSLVVFNSDEIRTVYECVPVEEVKEINDSTYQPSCCTPLYDAMGIAITKLRKKVAQDDRVLVTVITDGYENSSSEYSGNAIKTLVDEMKKQGWVFTYMGANQDVEAVAATISITNVMNFSATPEGTTDMLKKERSQRLKFFHRMSSQDFDAEDENMTYFDK